MVTSVWKTVNLVAKFSDSQFRSPLVCEAAKLRVIYQYCSRSRIDPVVSVRRQTLIPTGIIHYFELLFSRLPGLIQYCWLESGPLSSRLRESLEAQRDPEMCPCWGLVIHRLLFA